jgi:acetyl esterase/lipase/integrase
MATLFKPDRPYPLPENPEIVQKEGKPHIRIRENGKALLFPLTKDGNKYLKPANKWCADVRHADGAVKRVRFSPNRDAAAIMLSELIKRIENEKAGLIDPYAGECKSPLSKLLADYQQHQTDKGNTSKQAEQVRRRCELVFAGCGFALLSHLDTTPAESWLADRRRLEKKDGGMSVQTSNHYVTGLKSFGNWLVKAHRVRENPFRHLGKLNVEVDIRHVRRPLSEDEFSRLLTAARGGQVFRHLPGSDRAMLYLIAGMTGLRASELASLTPESFALDADPPLVVVAAAYSKHRRRDEIPLHLALVSEIRRWIAQKPEGESLWPGKWAKHNEAVDLIRRDLESARATWINEAQTPQEKKDREDSDFLKYRDNEGHVADFHSLRHRFVTELVRAGVAPKDAKELARHSTITLTMDRYAHVGIRDTAAAVGRLTLPGDSRPDSEKASLRLTGTDGGCRPGAVTGAVASGSKGGRSKTIGESGSADLPAKGSHKPRTLQAVGSNREGSETKEESTPSRSRTCNLRFRRPMLYPVELWVQTIVSAQPPWKSSSYRYAILSLHPILRPGAEESTMRHTAKPLSRVPALLTSSRTVGQEELRTNIPTRKRIMHRSLILLASCFVLTAASGQSADGPAKKVEPERLKLWNGNAPVGEGQFEKAEAWITVHKPEKANGTAIVICPGGGYAGLVTGAEGHGIAEWLNRHGITGIVLEYRLPKGRPFVPLLDAQRAIRTVRSNAKAWGIDTGKVGIMGFSAGGHLASTAGTHFDDGDPKSDDPVNKQGCRPDFMILIYPVISMGEKGHGGSRNNLLGSKPEAKLVDLFSNEKQVTAKTPPAFLAHAKDDRAVVAENSKMFYDALQAKKAPSKYLELPSGGHGLNGYKGPMWDAWQTQSLEWLGEIRMIPAMTDKK